MELPPKYAIVKNRSFGFFLQIYILAALVGALASLALILQNPSETAAAWVFGLSMPRAVLAAGLIAWAGIWGFLGSAIRFKHAWGNRIARGMQAMVRKPALYAFALAISLGGLFVCILLGHLARVVADPYVQGYLGRLFPVLMLIGMFSLQNLLLLPLMRFGWADLREMLSGKLLRTSGFLFGLILLLWASIVLTRLGLTPDLIGWDPPGVPVLAVQVWLACFIGLLFLGLERILNTGRFSRSLLFDIFFSVLIWGAAAHFWRGQPMAPDYFALAPQQPNFEFVPYSDAATHDVMAQRLLIGEGFSGIARKPLYVIFLALLHLLAGQSYQNVVSLQVMVIALFPVLIYWLTKSIHHRLSGVIAAVMIVLREKNAIALSGQIGVSHAKLLMSDLPATLGVVLLTWVIVAWLDTPQTRRSHPLAIGGILGLLLLIRPQIVVLVPIVALFLVILFVRRPSFGLQNLALMALGLGLALGPWLVRSYRLTGEFVLNDPAQNAFLTQQYSLDPGYDRVKPLPGETEGEYAQRVDAYLRDFIMENPGVVAGFIAAHFSHNLVEMIVALPMSPWLVQNPASDLFPYWVRQSDRLWKDCCSPAAYVNAKPFWDRWEGALSGEMVFSLVVNMAVIAIGLGVAWARRDIVGWTPLGVSLVYILSTAAGRYSGWRLILPADWAILLYFAIGLGQLIFWALAYFTRRLPADSNLLRSDNIHRRITDIQPKGGFPYSTGIILGIVFLGLGFAPVLIERFVPPRYSDITKDGASAYFEAFSDQEQLETLLADDRSVVFEGRALYPRFYKVGQGEPGGDWPAFSPRDYPRLSFVVAGYSHNNVILPVNESPPYFPHASDVIVLGCRAPDHISARLVVLSDDGGYTLLRSATDLTCDSLP